MPCTDDSNHSGPAWNGKMPAKRAGFGLPGLLPQAGGHIPGRGREDATGATAVQVKGAPRYLHGLSHTGLTLKTMIPSLSPLKTGCVQCRKKGEKTRLYLAGA
jgi:hypothetical protein